MADLNLVWLKDNNNKVELITLGILGFINISWLILLPFIFNKIFLFAKISQKVEEYFFKNCRDVGLTSKVIEYKNYFMLCSWRIEEKHLDTIDWEELASAVLFLILLLHGYSSK